MAKSPGGVSSSPGFGQIPTAETASARSFVGKFLVFVIPCVMFGGAADRFGGLLANSPFGAEPMVASAEPLGLEFHGYVYMDADVFLNITHTNFSSGPRGAWVRLDESQEDYVVRSFDQATETVEVVYRGQRVVLKLKQGRVQSLQETEHPGTVASVVSGAGPGVSSGINFPAGADEKTRLEIVADEIRLRRVVREVKVELNAQGER